MWLLVDARRLLSVASTIVTGLLIIPSPIAAGHGKTRLRCPITPLRRIVTWPLRQGTIASL